MAVITSENREAWQALADHCEPRRPSVGKTVTVARGRKHVGKTGRVFWHGRNKFESSRYRDDARKILGEMIGRAGYRVGIDTGEERFYVSAENVDVVNYP